MSVDVPANEMPAQSRERLGRDIGRNPLAVISIVIITLVTTAVFLAPVIAPFNPLEQDLDHILEGPTAMHLLGTDSLGRDTLTRLLYGGQPALLGVVVAVATFLVIGVTLGLLAGYLGGAVDKVVGAVIDVLMSLPGIVLVLAVLAIFGQNVFAAMFTFGVLVSGSLTRIVRASVLSIRQELFVAAAAVSGLSSGRIMLRHVLPGLAGPVAVQLSLFAGGALALQTGLGFLGLATPPPTPSWGGLVGEGASVMVLDPFLLFVSGGTIAVMTIAFALLGDSIRDLIADVKRPPRSTRQPARASVEVSPFAPAPLLQVHDYSISFTDSTGKSIPAVQNLAFTIDAGEIVGLVGESGSGKTVTALSVLGLLPRNAVTSGAAWLDGQSLADASTVAAIRGRKVGLVSQEPAVALDPLFTVGALMDEVLSHLTNLRRSARRARALELLAAVRLPEPDVTLSKYPYELSGGMVQRVVIALALAGDPELLIADEPTTALDVTVQAGILDLLRQLRRERNLAVLIVTHDLAVVADLCDRAIVMEHGRIVEQASVEDIFYHPRHPYTRRLLSSTPSLLEVPNG